MPCGAAPGTRSRASWTCRRGTIGGGEVDVAAEDWFATYPGIIPDEIQRQLLDSWYPHQH